MSSRFARHRVDDAESCRNLILNRLSRYLSTDTIRFLLHDFEPAVIVEAYDSGFRLAFPSLERARRACVAKRYEYNGKQRLEAEEKQRQARIKATKANEDKLCQEVVELVCGNPATGSISRKARQLGTSGKRSHQEKDVNSFADQARHAFDVITNIGGIDARSRWLASLHKDEDWSHQIVALIQHVDANMDKQSKEATAVKMDFWRMWRSSRPEEDE
jgi:hypothetical protein